MIDLKYLKLLLYLIVCIAGYLTGLYIGYKKIINYLSDSLNTGDIEHTVDKCYSYKKVPKPCQ